MVPVELLVAVDAAMPLEPEVAVEFEPLDAEAWELPPLELPGGAVAPGG